MPTSRVQTLRSAVKKQRPAQGSREVGELFINFPDAQLGVIDTAKAPVDLIAVRFFSAATDYAIGDYVVQAGNLYRAKAAVSAAAFTPAQWDLIYNKAQVDAALALKLDVAAYTAADVLAKIITVDGVGSGLDADFLDGQNGSYYATAASLVNYAPINAPVFTGDARAVTPVPGDSDTSIATTAFVASAITALNLGTYAPINNPVFTGDPQAPTRNPGDNDTSIATTAFVTAAVSAKQPGEAPNDSNAYGRKALGWVDVPEEAPSDGITYGRKNGAWAASIGGATVSDEIIAPPLVPGQLWWESDTGILYLYYDDGNSTQWVQVAPGQASTVVLESPRTARNRNLVTNPCMQISQENGDTASAVVTNLTYFPADEWLTSAVLTGAISAARYNVSNLHGLTNTRVQININNITASLTAAQYIQIVHKIEGLKCQDFKWGGASAKPAVLRFTALAPAGTYSIAIKNTPVTMTYLANFTVAQTGVAQTFVIPIPGATSGTWATDNTTGILLAFGLAAGSTFLGVAGWQSGNMVQAAGASNLAATVNNYFAVTDVGLYLDPDNTGLAPAFEVPDYAEELLACQRYYYRIAQPYGPESYRFNNAGSVPADAGLIPFKVTMRATPTAGLAVSPTLVNCSAPVLGANSVEAMLRVTVTASGPYLASNGTYTFSARM